MGLNLKLQHATRNIDSTREVSHLELGRFADVNQHIFAGTIQEKSVWPIANFPNARHITNHSLITE